MTQSRAETTKHFLPKELKKMLKGDALKLALGFAKLDGTVNDYGVDRLKNADPERLKDVLNRFTSTFIKDKHKFTSQDWTMLIASL